MQNLKIARTKAWRTANTVDDIGDQSENRYIIPRDFNPEISAAWTAFDSALNELNAKKETLPSFENQAENDVV